MTTSRTIKLTEQLSEFGEVQTCSEGVVVAVLITGKGLSGFGNVIQVSEKITNIYGKDYPYLQAYKNSDEFIMVVLCKEKV